MSNALLEEARRYRPYSQALYQALKHDPFYATLEASVTHPHAPREAMLRYYDYSIYEGVRFGHVVQAGDPPVGISVWSVPLDNTTSQVKSDTKADVILGAMGRAALDTYKNIVTSMSATSGPVTSKADWYLSIAGLLPAYQGKGLGGDLIRPVLEDADAAGVATYLETFVPRNMSFYRKLGYSPVGQFREPVTQATYHVMRRAAP